MAHLSKKSLRTKLIFLTAASALSGCAYNPKKLTPAFIDTDRMTCREYVVTQTKPTVEFAFKESHPIEWCNGFISLPPEQALEIKRHYEASRKKRSVATETPKLCTTFTTMPPTTECEIDMLDGVILNDDSDLTEIKQEYYK